MGFQIKEPPPIHREGRKRKELDPDEAKALFGLMSAKDEDGNYPWAFDDRNYKSKAMGQSQVLFYRRELHRQGFVEHPRQIQGRVVAADTVGGTEGQFAFGLRFRELSAINDLTGTESEDGDKPKGKK